MTKEEKFKTVIDYILESERSNYYEYCLDRKYEKYKDCVDDISEEEENYMDNIETEDYLNSEDNKHIYVYAKLLQKHLNLN